MGTASSKSVEIPSPVGARFSGAWAVAENGVVAGFIGAVVVAAWFLTIDAIQGQPFHTPSLIGSVVFRGASVVDAQAVDGAMIFAYTGMHGVLFFVVGLLFAWVFTQIDEHPQLGVLLILVFLLFQAILFGLEVTIVPRLVGAIGAASVGFANLISVGAMCWFLLTRNPHLVEHLREGMRENH